MEENADAEKVKRGVEKFQFKDSEHHAVFYVEIQPSVSYTRLTLPTNREV